MANRLAFLGGKVFTADPQNSIAGGVYAEDGKIRAVGAKEEVRKALPPDTTIVEIAGKTLVPGFIDAHCHPVLFGAGLGQVDCRYPRVASPEDLAAVISEGTAMAPEGEWVRGWGLDHDKFPGGRMPTRWEVDEISPHHPVFVLHVGGHHALVNSAALEKAGVTDATPDPKSGHFIRDGRGRMTGMILDAAQQVVMKSSINVGNHGPSTGIYDAPLDELVAQIYRSYTEFVKVGITTVVDAQVTGRELRAYIEARRRGKLSLRTTCMVLSNHLPEFRALGLGGPLGDDRLALGPMKFYADGSLPGSTGAFEEPYLHQPGFHGHTFWSGEELREIVGQAHAMGLQVGIHAQGDRGIEISLDAIEAALRAQPRDDHRHRIEHAGYATEAQLERAAALGVMAIGNPRFLYEVGETFLKNLGPARARRITPLRSQLDLGIPVALGSDIPVSSFNPLDIIWSAVTRHSLAGADMGAGERITVAEALRASTIDAARSIFQERHRGSIEVGKAADFALIGGDLLGSAVDDIPGMPIEMTVIGSDVVYGELEVRS